MAKKPADPADAVNASRADALKFIQKHAPSSFRDPDEGRDLVGVSTGSIAIDYIIGNGGFPRRKVSEIFGAPSSGKSTLAAMACAKAQKMGQYPVYVDVERGLDRAFAERMGFDVGAALTGDRGLYVTPDTFEDMLIVVEQMATKGEADLIIVDSVMALVPEDLFKKKISEMSAYGAQAKMFSGSLPRLTKIIDRPENACALVFVNQIRANIQSGWAPPGAPATKAAGGYALEHFSSLRIELKQIKKDAKIIERKSITDPDKPEKIPVASRHTAKTFKNKVSLPYRSIEFYIRYDEEKDIWGIDNLQTTIDIAVSEGMIDTKSGGRFSYTPLVGEVAQSIGEDNFYQLLRERPELIMELRERLKL